MQFSYKNCNEEVQETVALSYLLPEIKRRIKEPEKESKKNINGICRNKENVKDNECN